MAPSPMAANSFFLFGTPLFEYWGYDSKLSFAHRWPRKPTTENTIPARSLDRQWVPWCFPWTLLRGKILADATDPRESLLERKLVRGIVVVARVLGIVPSRSVGVSIRARG